MENRMKLVDFTNCNTCEFKNVADYEDPCNDCLSTPTNEYSHKPVNYKKKDTIDRY